MVRLCVGVGVAGYREIAEGWGAPAVASCSPLWHSSKASVSRDWPSAHNCPLLTPCFASRTVQAGFPLSYRPWTLLSSQPEQAQNTGNAPLFISLSWKLADHSETRFGPTSLAFPLAPSVPPLKILLIFVRLPLPCKRKNIFCLILRHLHISEMGAFFLPIATVFLSNESLSLSKAGFAFIWQDIILILGTENLDNLRNQEGSLL